jgi:hypothetical protein
VGAAQTNAAGAVQMDQRRALSRFQVTDPEAIGLHVALGEGRARCGRHDLLPNLCHDRTIMA